MKSTSTIKRAIASIVIVVALMAGARFLAFINAGMWYSPTATIGNVGADPNLSRCLPREVKFSDLDQANDYAESVRQLEVGVYADSSGGYIVVMTKPDSECSWLDDFRANEISWGAGFIGSMSSLLFLMFLIHIVRFNRPGIYDGWRDLPEEPSKEEKQAEAIRIKTKLIEAQQKLLIETAHRDELAVQAAVALLARTEAEAKVLSLNDGQWPTLPQDQRIDPNN